MSQHHHVGGATGVGTRAVVVRGGPVLRTERHTVVDETDRTVTVDDGTRFAKTTGPVRDAPEADPAEPDGAHAPVRLVTEGMVRTYSATIRVESATDVIFFGESGDWAAPQSPASQASN